MKAKGSHKHFEIEELVVEPKNITLINDKVKYIENNYAILQNKIRENKDKVEKMIKENLHHLTSS